MVSQRECTGSDAGHGERQMRPTTKSTASAASPEAARRRARSTSAAPEEQEQDQPAEADDDEGGEPDQGVLDDAEAALGLRDHGPLGDALEPLLTELGGQRLPL